MKVIFAHPRFEYGSYVDYRKMVDLSGFESCFFDEIDLAKGGVLYVASPANHSLFESLRRFDAPDKVRSKVVFWNLEDPELPTVPVWDLKTTEVHASTESVFSLPGVIRGWASNRTLPARDGRYVFVPMGSHPGLRESRLAPARWDLSQMSYVWGRRGPILERLQARFRVAPASFGPTRAEALASSRAVYCVHQREGKILVEPLRLALAAAYFLPYLTEEIDDNPSIPGPLYPFQPSLDYESFPYGLLADGVRHWLEERPPEQLTSLGTHLHKTLAIENSFKVSVERAVRSTLS